MKFFWLGIVLVSALLGVGVACGPKEKYCYLEGESCDQALKDKNQKEIEREQAEAGAGMEAGSTDGGSICVNCDAN